MKDDIWPRNSVERKGECRDFVGPKLELGLYRYWQSPARVNLPYMPAYLQSVFTFALLAVPVHLNAAATTKSL